ncbi:PREDICTED: glioma pathogenesis-related protein 1-like [Crocodylus porosus]|uniref:glioma pathogenesis-related protein 1-like n=1 Tax=Crocodylus porosus TaxID=8502 RepID=UPI000939321D|nr:PREDICTED: glioma pathogenesis-related protein 1-like [Crocodylus porosus]
MRLWLAAVLGPWALLGVWSAPQVKPNLPSITNRTFIEQCEYYHNHFRRLVTPPAANMHYMTWDAALARNAKAWSRKCLFKHNLYLQTKDTHPSFRPLGENIFTGNHRAFSVKAAVQLWYDEYRDYTYETRKCTTTCGHYTQVVWDNSYKVGCAVSFCPEVAGIKNAGHFICNYAPSGNYPRKPYQKGAPCSQCPRGDTCVNKLCKNATRDRIIEYYNWRPPWVKGCDEFCIYIVALRPSLTLLACVAVFLIKLYYPNMHIS